MKKLQFCNRTSLLKLNNHDNENVIPNLKKTLKFHVLFLSKNGQTALHIAAQKNSQKVVTFLLNRDCDPQITNVAVGIS